MSMVHGPQIIYHIIPLFTLRESYGGDVPASAAGRTCWCVSFLVELVMGRRSVA